MAKKKNTAFLTESWRDFFASCLVVISIFVVLFTTAGIGSKSYIITAAVDGAYLLALYGYILLFTGRSRSEVLKRLMALFSIVATPTSIFLLWAFFTFSI